VKDTGGIITVRSELGGPTHKVNNRALRLWEDGDSVFKLRREKRGSWLQEHRAEVIQRLDAGYFNPLFPMKKDGQVVEDLGDMTHAFEVCHPRRPLAWSVSAQTHGVTGDWRRRFEERFAGVQGGQPKAPELQSYNSLDKPSIFVTCFLEKYLPAKERLLAHEDKSYLNIAQHLGQKPAPILDNNFEVWFEKVQPLRILFKRSSIHSFVMGFSLGIGGYRS
jgi:enoyl reductase-like protein